VLDAFVIGWMGPFVAPQGGQVVGHASSRLAETVEPVRELAAAFGIGRAAAYRYLNSHRSANAVTNAAM
jgi:hypothetical protein